MRQRRGRRERAPGQVGEPESGQAGDAPEPTTTPQPAYDPAAAQTTASARAEQPRPVQPVSGYEPPRIRYDQVVGEGPAADSVGSAPQQSYDVWQPFTQRQQPEDSGPQHGQYGQYEPPRLHYPPVPPEPRPWDPQQQQDPPYQQHPDGQYEPQRYQGSGYPGSGYPGSGYPGSGYPGSGYPGSGYPGSGYQDQWQSPQQWEQGQWSAPEPLRAPPEWPAPQPPPDYDFEEFYRPREPQPSGGPLPPGQPTWVRPAPEGTQAGSGHSGLAQLGFGGDGSGRPEQPPPPVDELPPPRDKRRRRRIVVAVVAVVVLILAAAGTGGGYYLLRTHGSASETAASYLRAWGRGDYAAMQKDSVSVPRGGLSGPVTKLSSELGVRHQVLKLGAVKVTGHSAVAPFTVTDHLTGGHVWTYTDQLRLLVKNQHWWVNWSLAAIYPGLKTGDRFKLTAEWPPRAPILGAGGTVLSAPATIAESGSIALLTGYLGAATAAQARKLGAPYRKGDVIGQSGLEQAYQTQLAGLPSLTISVAGHGRHAATAVMRFPARMGTPVRTSIDMNVQLAASAAVSAAKTSKPVDMVVVQPSTGHVLAVVERPGGFDRALDGIFPPGSTFKIITASALINSGLTAASRVPCPSQVTIDGRTFHNDDNEHYGTISLQTAFAVSCDSTFAQLATERLSGATLRAMAKKFGYNATPELGIPVTLGHFSTPLDPVDLAADAFGQGDDLANPLSQASVAAAIEDGSWRPPVLVVSPKVHQVDKPHAISPTILDALRPMMRAVVTSGTAAHVGFGPGVYGKTGTAQYGNGVHSDGWFIGYQGDIAFAVIVEGGGYGADSAGPVANAFLRHL